MTLEEQKAKALAEYNAVLEWSVKESEKVIERLKREGRFLYLDGHAKEFDYIKQTRQRRLKEIGKKYGLIEEEQ